MTTIKTVWDRTGNSWCLIREDLWCHAGTDEATYRELPLAQLEAEHGPLKTIDGDPVTAAAVDTTATGTLNLYLVERGDDVNDDETTTYMAAATDPAQARRAGESVAGHQPASIWWQPTTTVTPIGRADPQVDPGVVIADYHAG